MNQTKNRENLVKSLELQLYRQLYQRSFYDFFVAAVQVLEPQTDWVFNWHIKELCAVVQEEVFRLIRKEPKTKDLIIGVPPRTSKSNIFSIVLPVWIWIAECESKTKKDKNGHPVWLNYRQCKLITISHTESLAVEHSTSSFRLLQTEWFRNLFPEVELSRDTNSKSNYANTVGGQRMATGISAASLGLTANILILDDPNSSISQQELNNTIEQFKGPVFSRLGNPKTDFRIIIQQRLSFNDITGFCLRTSPDRYNHICLPAEATEDIRPEHLSQYYVDGLLWPDRFDREVLKGEREIKGSQGYASQFLLRPQMKDGGIIKRDWFDTVTTYPSGLKWCLFIDGAYTKKTKNDPSAIIVCAFNPADNCIYIREVFQVWLEFPELVKKIKQIGANYPDCKIYIEPKASGLSVVQEIRSNTQLNVIELDSPKGDKPSRVNAISAKLEAKRVKLFKDDWNELLLDEVSGFPLAVHDDITDCLTYAVEKLLGSGAGKIRWYM